MKHLTDAQLATELENRRNALHNACQRDAALRPVLGQILAVMQEAAIRLRRAAHASDLARMEKERKIDLPDPPPPRKRGGPAKPMETEA